MYILKNLFLIIILLSLNLFAKPDTPNPSIASNFGVTVVNTQTAKSLHESGAIFVDTRKVPEYAYEHIYGAISAYYDEKGGNANKQINFDNSNDIYYDSRLKDKKQIKLIFYCNGIKY